jgi:hypothetical protein
MLLGKRQVKAFNFITQKTLTVDPPTLEPTANVRG